MTPQWYINSYERHIAELQQHRVAQAAAASARGEGGPVHGALVRENEHGRFRCVQHHTTCTRTLLVVIHCDTTEPCARLLWVVYEQLSALARLVALRVCCRLS